MVGGYNSAGSTIELSPDEKTLAINNRNAQLNVLEDIILFDITNFNSTTYQPVTISVPNLRLQDMPDKNLAGSLYHHATIHLF